MQKLKEKEDTTIVINRDEYEGLQKKAQILERVLDFIPERAFPIEIYSDQRIKEFASEDKLNKDLKKKLTSI